MATHSLAGHEKILHEIISVLKNTLVNNIFKMYEKNDGCQHLLEIFVAFPTSGIL